MNPSILGGTSAAEWDKPSSSEDLASWIVYGAPMQLILRTVKHSYFYQDTIARYIRRFIAPVVDRTEHTLEGERNTTVKLAVVAVATQGSSAVTKHESRPTSLRLRAVELWCSDLLKAARQERILPSLKECS